MHLNIESSSVLLQGPPASSFTRLVQWAERRADEHRSNLDAGHWEVELSLDIDLLLRVGATATTSATSPTGGAKHGLQGRLRHHREHSQDLGNPGMSTEIRNEELDVPLSEGL